MNHKIAFENVSCVFELNGKPFTAVDDVSLDIADNEFITVVGPSGCGKSTLMNLAAGLLDPTSGRVSLDGKTLSGPGPDRGVIFQQYALFPWLTVRKNVEFGLRLQKLPKGQRDERVDDVLDLVGLTRFADAWPKALSGGMKQRCAIARAYAANPSVLLMDEPFGALDALTRVTMQEQLLQTWTRDKRTVMFITHDVEEAVYLANRVVVMAANPGHIQQIVDIDLPYPRTEEIRLSTEFAQLRNQVWNAVYHHNSAENAS